MQRYGRGARGVFYQGALFHGKPMRDARKIFNQARATREWEKSESRPLSNAH